MPVLILGIWPFIVYWPGILVITPLATAMKFSIRQFCLGPHPRELSQWRSKGNITSKAAPRVWTLRTAMQECPCVLIIIREIQLLETKEMRWAKMEHWILWCKKHFIKGCAKSFRNNHSTGKRGLPASVQAGRISIFIMWWKAVVCAKVY